MSVNDVNAQCLIEYEGQWFICPRYKRDEAENIFDAFDELLETDNEFIPPQLPDYLIPVGSIDDLVFFSASEVGARS